MSTILEYRRFRRDLDVVEGSSEADTLHRQQRRLIINVSFNAPMFLGAIDKVFVELDGIPGAYTEDTTIAEGLGVADGDFDGYGGGLFFRFESELRIPGQEEARRKAIEAARDDLTPSLSIFRATYAQEALDARAKEPLLEKHRATLESLPVTGGTLFDWAKRHIDAGLRIEALLAERALAHGTSVADRRRIFLLRNQLAGLVAAFQQALGQEATLRDEVPDNAVAVVFSWLNSAR